MRAQRGAAVRLEAGAPQVCHRLLLLHGRQRLLVFHPFPGRRHRSLCLPCRLPRVAIRCAINALACRVVGCGGAPQLPGQHLHAAGGPRRRGAALHCLAPAVLAPVLRPLLLRLLRKQRRPPAEA